MTQRARLSDHDLTEDATQAAIFEHIAVRGARDAVFFHIFSNPRSARDGARLKRLGLKKGMADIGVIHKGRLLLLEVKRRGGRQSPSQIATMHECVAAGAVYTCCYGLEHCLEVLEAWKVLSRRAWWAP